MRRLLLCAVVMIFTAAFGLSAVQSQDDEGLWREWVAWLKTAPPANDVNSVIGGYGAELTRRGLSPGAAKQTIGSVLRLMRSRPDAWQLIFDRLYANSSATFKTAPNALLVGAVEGVTPGQALDVGMGQGRNAVFLALRRWKVTGFDLSEQGLASAREQAKKAGLQIEAVQADEAGFDYGDARWVPLKVTFCTRQLVISPTSSSFSLRQSIELASPNSFGSLPAAPNLPTTLPSSCTL